MRIPYQQRTITQKAQQPVEAVTNQVEVAGVERRELKKRERETKTSIKEGRKDALHPISKKTIVQIIRTAISFEEHMKIFRNKKTHPDGTHVAEVKEMNTRRPTQQKGEQKLIAYQKNFDPSKNKNKKI